MPVYDYESGFLFIFLPTILSILGSWFFVHRGRPILGIKTGVLVLFVYLALYWFTAMVRAYLFDSHRTSITAGDLVQSLLVISAVAVFDIVPVVTFPLLIALGYKLFARLKPVNKHISADQR